MNNAADHVAVRSPQIAEPFRLREVQAIARQKCLCLVGSIYVQLEDAVGAVRKTRLCGLFRQSVQALADLSVSHQLADMNLLCFEKWSSF